MGPELTDFAEGLNGLDRVGFHFRKGGMRSAFPPYGLRLHFKRAAWGKGYRDSRGQGGAGVKEGWGEEYAGRV
jgi:hypothetical protein